MKQRKMKTPYWGIVLLLFVLALAACGNNNSKGSQNSAELPTVAGAETSSVAPAASTEPTDALSATKIVTTINGDIEIPTRPQRIVTDDYLGALIALDVIPIGTPGLHLENLYFAEALAGIEDIGAYGNSSIEKIIDLQPDLIITSGNDETKYNLLSKAAPTISVPYGQLKNAHEELNYFGELLGREAEATAWLADYDERVAQAKSKVDKAIPPDATFTILEDTDKAVYVYGDNFGRGGQPVYQALGRTPPSSIAAEIMEKQYKEISLEVLADYAGDYIILTSDSKTLEDYKQDPIWNTLKAVQNDHLYVWKEERSWYYDPIAVLSQTEELAAWISEE